MRPAMARRQLEANAAPVLSGSSWHTPFPRGINGDGGGTAGSRDKTRLNDGRVSSAGHWDGLYFMVRHFCSLDGYSRRGFRVLPVVDTRTGARTHIFLRQTFHKPAVAGELQNASDDCRRRNFLCAGPSLLQHFHPTHIRCERHITGEQYAHSRGTSYLAHFRGATERRVLDWFVAGDCGRRRNFLGRPRAPHAVGSGRSDGRGRRVFLWRLFDGYGESTRHNEYVGVSAAGDICERGLSINCKSRVGNFAARSEGALVVSAGGPGSGYATWRGSCANVRHGTPRS